MNLNISIVAEISMCSLPTMKLSGALPGCFEASCSDGDGFGSAAFSRGGPLSFSLCTYKVRMIKNCPVELAISFKTFRATAGAPLPSESWCRRWSRRNSSFFRQRCAVKRSHAVHFGVQQDIYEHLYLGELLSEQRRHGCFRQSGGKFIETELKFVWEFHVVRVRSV